MIGVAALILSGIVNAWILVGSFRASLVTDYGQLLLLKIVAFVVMLGFAAVNRFWLTPQLAVVMNAQADTNAKLPRQSAHKLASYRRRASQAPSRKATKSDRSGALVVISRSWSAQRMAESKEGECGD